MSAEEADRAGRPFVGFHTFADDTPREVEPPASGDWPLAGDGQGDVARPPRRPRSSTPSKGFAAALIGLGLVGGTAVGLVLNTQRKPPADIQPSSVPTPIHVAPPAAPMAMAVTSAPTPIAALPSPDTPETSAVPPLAAGTAPSQAVPAKPAASPAVAPSPVALAAAAAPSTLPARPSPSPFQTRIEILPAPPPAARPQPGAPGPAASQAAAADSPQAVSAAPQVPAQLAPRPQIAELTPPAPILSRAPAASEESCRYARSRAELMVCSDPQLAAQDRQLTRAYREALAAGAPERRLAREQEDWLNARDDAARRSRREVANLYALRLDDLAQWVDDDEAPLAGRP